MNELDLTPLEQAILQRSSDQAMTRMRKKGTVIAGIFLAAVFAVAGFWTKSWALLLAMALAHILLTMWQRIMFANSALACKRLIQKLRVRIDQLSAGQAPEGE